VTFGEEFESLADAPATGSGMLEQAVRYLLACLRQAAPARLSCPTPCAGWDLRMLLSHVSESLEALTEGLACGVVGSSPAPAVSPGAEIASVRVRCARLLAAAATPGSPAGPGVPATPGVPAAATPGVPAAPGCSGDPAGHHVAVGDRDMTRALLSWAGAVEVAVHGWDIGAACGRPEPVPCRLAGPLLRAAPLLVSASVRDGLFGAPVPVPAGASAGSRLVAFLGRRPEQPMASV